MHSPIGASSYHRWKHCPGSVNLSRGIISEPSEAAQTGTRVHEICAEVLTGQKSLEYFEVFEEEALLYGARIYIAEIRRELKEGSLHGSVQYGIEESFDMSESVFPELFGTTDCWIYREDNFTLKVFDYKNGKTKVEVERNAQLLYYALGALLKISKRVDRIELVIVQPNSQGDAIRRWEIGILDMLDFWADLEQDAKCTTYADSPLQMGKWCFFCPARKVCPEIDKENLRRAQEAFA